jgi:hypothetical protein
VDDQEGADDCHCREDGPSESAAAARQGVEVIALISHAAPVRLAPARNLPFECRSYNECCMTQVTLGERNIAVTRPLTRRLAAGRPDRLRTAAARFAESAPSSTMTGLIRSATASASAAAFCRASCPQVSAIDGRPQRAMASWVFRAQPPVSRPSKIIADPPGAPRPQRAATPFG